MRVSEYQALRPLVVNLPYGACPFTTAAGLRGAVVTLAPTRIKQAAQAANVS